LTDTDRVFQTERAGGYRPPGPAEGKIGLDRPVTPLGTHHNGKVGSGSAGVRRSQEARTGILGVIAEGQRLAKGGG
jgi:hypothetical protein